MDVLISFVGNQDPLSEKTNEEGAVITLCRRIKPEIVYLLPTAKGPGVRSSTEENAKFAEELLKEEFPQTDCYIRPLALEDPTNFQELLPCTKETLKRILSDLQRINQDLNIHLNCSSGTPQMKACWYVLAHSGFIPAAHLWQVHNPAIVAEEERVREIELNFLEEENIVSRIHQYLPQFFFKVMADDCRKLYSISLYSSRRSIADLMAQIFEAYNYWDLLHYREAYQRLSKVERLWSGTQDANDAAEVLKKQVEFLKILEFEQEQEIPENLVDIYYNAKRSFARENYTDTLARFWRLYEGIVYYRLREKWGVEPTNLDNSSNQENRGKVNICLKQGAEKRLNLWQATRFLQNELSDNGYSKIIDSKIEAQRSNSLQEMTLGKLLEELRLKRNRSLVGHGMKPVSREDAINSLRAAELLLTKSLADGGELLDAYPLQEESIRLLFRLLAES